MLGDKQLEEVKNNAIKSINNGKIIKTNNYYRYNYEIKNLSNR